MPVMDGYKATHTIRTASPFAENQGIQNTPIVAMTASAIQGDREKCESAGMNDYLAKPVKGKLLEEMLVKWALQKKKQSAPPSAKPADAPTKASPQRPDVHKVESSSSLKTQTSSNSAKDLEGSHAGTLRNELSRIEFNHQMIEQSTEEPGERALRHLHNQERAIHLRDEQLLESGENPKERLGRGISDESMHGGRPEKLTKENMEKFKGKKGKQDDESTSSMAVAVGEDVEKTKKSRSRPSVLRQESQSTITP